MSIILDSLKRAERERRVGDTPAIDTLYGEKPPPPAGSPKSKKRWLAGLLLVNLVVIAFLAVALFQKRPAPEVGVPQAQPAVQKAAGNEEVIQPLPPSADKVIAASAPVKDQSSDQPTPEVKKTLPAPEPSAPQKEIASPEDVRFGPPVAVTEDDLKAATIINPPPVLFNPAGKTAVQTPAADVDQPSAPETLARTTPPVDPAPALETEILSSPNDAQTPVPTHVDEEPQWVRVPQQRPAENTLPPVKQAHVAVAPAPPTAFQTNAAPAPAPPAKNPPPAPDRIDQAPLLKDLPPDVREKLKTVKISVLVYAEPQTACMVYINSRRYRTGDRIGTEGYLLERITPDGIILDYGKGRVKIRSGY